jgi:hypothetical protein
LSSQVLDLRFMLQMKPVDLAGWHRPASCVSNKEMWAATPISRCRGFVNISAIGVGVWQFVEGENTVE